MSDTETTPEDVIKPEAPKKAQSEPKPPKAQLKTIKLAEIEKLRFTDLSGNLYRLEQVAIRGNFVLKVTKE